MRPCRAGIGGSVNSAATVNFCAVSRSTETSWLTPFSPMVTPNRRFMRAMVIGWCVMTRKRVAVSAAIFSIRVQKRSTLASSSGASTSSSTQIGDGLVRNTAKISAMAVSDCSPPDSSESVAGFLPGGLATISSPPSSGSSASIISSRASPPPNSVVNRRGSGR